MVSTFFEFVASLGVAFSWIFSSRMKPGGQQDDRNRLQRKLSKHSSLKHRNHRNQLYIVRSRKSFTLNLFLPFRSNRQWFPLPICIRYRLFSHVPLQLPSQSSASIAPCTFTRIHLNRSMHRVTGSRVRGGPTVESPDQWRRQGLAFSPPCFNLRQPIGWSVPVSRWSEHGASTPKMAAKSRGH